MRRNGQSVIPEYSTDVLVDAVGRLTDADSFALGMRVLISNYRLLSDSDAIVVSRFDEERDVVVEMFASSYAQTMYPSGLSRPVETTGAGHFLEFGPATLNSSVIEDLTRRGNIDFASYQLRTVKSVVGVPIVWKLQTVGVIQLLRLAGADSMHSEFVERLAVLLAPHLALARSQDTEKTVRDQYGELTEIAGIAASGSGLQAFLIGVANYLRQHVGFDAVAVQIRSDLTQMPVLEFQEGVIDLSLIEATAGIEKTLSSHVFKISEFEKKPFVVRSKSAIGDAESNQATRSLLGHIPSILIAPMWGSRGLIGTIECYSLNQGAYGQHDIEVIDRLAGVTLNGIIQSQMMTAMNQQIYISKSLAELARISSAGVEYETVLPSICTELSKILPFEHITFYIPDQLITDADGLPTQVGEVSYSAIPNSKIRHLGVSEIGSVTASLLINENPLFTKVERLSGVENEEASYAVISTKNPLRESEQELLQNSAHHITPAINSMILQVRNTQFLEQKNRVDQAESDVQRYQSIDKAKKEILSTVTHELRTPLASISAFVDIFSGINSENLTHGQLNNLKVIRRGSQAISNIVNDLDELASLEPSKLHLTYETVELSELLKDFENDMRPLLESTRHVLRLTSNGKDIPAVVDRTRLAQVLSNLVNNAAKYSPPNSIIRLLLRVNDRNAHFFVKDEGDGIPLEEQADLFSLFTRAETQENGSVVGSGIGLYVCEKIVQAHGGDINLYSKPGSGTTIHFWVPIDKPEG